MGDLVNKSEDDMMKVRNLGRKSLEEVMAKLDSLGFTLTDVYKRQWLHPHYQDWYAPR